MTQKLPLSLQDESFIGKKRNEIRAILDGHDHRLLLIVGPCALQPSPSLFDYARKLNQLQKEVESSFLIVMRAYFEKARTINGWRGSAYSSGATLNTATSLEESLYMTREALLSLTSMRVPLAAEFIDPLIAPFFTDLISWGSIGARTIHSQTHRILASSFSFPCGMKNSVEGSIEAACHAIKVAQMPHAFLTSNTAGKVHTSISQGNPYAHLVLRGGPLKPNYSPQDICMAKELLTSLGVNESIIIDCSHGNSQKQYREQPKVFHTIIDNYIKGLTPTVRGAMIESYLLGGSLQDVISSPRSDEEKKALAEQVSHIDPCLDWRSTEETIRAAHHKLLFLRLHQHERHNNSKLPNSMSLSYASTSCCTK